MSSGCLNSPYSKLTFLILLGPLIQKISQCPEQDKQKSNTPTYSFRTMEDHPILSGLTSKLNPPIFFLSRISSQMFSQTCLSHQSCGKFLNSRCSKKSFLLMPPQTKLFPRFLSSAPRQENYTFSEALF